MINNNHFIHIRVFHKKRYFEFIQFGFRNLIHWLNKFNHFTIYLMNEEISLNFEHLPSKCPKITLEPQQKETITSSLPSLQRIIHYMFWSKARLNAHDDYILLSVLSGNMISIYKQKNFRSKSKIDINIDTASLN